MEYNSADKGKPPISPDRGLVIDEGQHDLPARREDVESPDMFVVCPADVMPVMATQDQIESLAKQAGEISLRPQTPSSQSLSGETSAQRSDSSDNQASSSLSVDPEKTYSAGLSPISTGVDYPLKDFTPEETEALEKKIDAVLNAGPEPNAPAQEQLTLDQLVAQNDELMGDQHSTESAEAQAQQQVEQAEAQQQQLVSLQAVKETVGQVGAQVLKIKSQMTQLDGAGSSSSSGESVLFVSQTGPKVKQESGPPSVPSTIVITDSSQTTTPRSSESPSEQPEDLEDPKALQALLKKKQKETDKIKKKLKKMAKKPPQPIPIKVEEKEKPQSAYRPAVPSYVPKAKRKQSLERPQQQQQLQQDPPESEMEVALAPGTAQEPDQDPEQPPENQPEPEKESDQNPKQGTSGGDKTMEDKTIYPISPKMPDYIMSLNFKNDVVAFVKDLANLLTWNQVPITADLMLLVIFDDNEKLADQVKAKLDEPDVKQRVHDKVLTLDNNRAYQLNYLYRQSALLASNPQLYVVTESGLVLTKSEVITIGDPNANIFEPRHLEDPDLTVDSVETRSIGELVRRRKLPPQQAITIDLPPATLLERTMQLRYRTEPFNIETADLEFHKLMKKVFYINEESDWVLFNQRFPQFTKLIWLFGLTSIKVCFNEVDIHKKKDFMKKWTKVKNHTKEDHVFHTFCQDPYYGIESISMSSPILETVAVVRISKMRNRGGVKIPDAWFRIWKSPKVIKLGCGLVQDLTERLGLQTLGASAKLVNVVDWHDLCNLPIVETLYPQIYNTPGLYFCCQLQYDFNFGPKKFWEIDNTLEEAQTSDGTQIATQKRPVDHLNQNDRNYYACTEELEWYETDQLLSWKDPSTGKLSIRHDAYQANASLYPVHLLLTLAERLIQSDPDGYNYIYRGYPMDDKYFQEIWEELIPMKRRYARIVVGSRETERYEDDPALGASPTQTPKKKPQTVPDRLLEDVRKLELFKKWATEDFNFHLPPNYDQALAKAKAKKKQAIKEYGSSLASTTSKAPSKRPSPSSSTRNDRDEYPVFGAASEPLDETADSNLISGATKDLSLPVDTYSHKVAGYTHPVFKNPPTLRDKERREILNFWKYPISTVDNFWNDLYLWHNSTSGVVITSKKRLWATCTPQEFEELYGSKTIEQPVRRLQPRSAVDEAADKVQFYNQIRQKNETTPARKILEAGCMSELEQRIAKFEAQALFPERFLFPELGLERNEPQKMRKMLQEKVSALFKYSEYLETPLGVRPLAKDTMGDQWYPGEMEMDLTRPVPRTPLPYFVSCDVSAPKNKEKVIVLYDRAGEICHGCGSKAHSFTLCNIINESKVPLRITREEVAFINFQSTKAEPKFRVQCTCCGSRIHKTEVCQRRKEKDVYCAYPYCGSKEHLVQMCPVLHSMCPICHFRGHKPGSPQCSPGMMEANRVVFNSYQPAGVCTRLANAPFAGVEPLISWGYYPVLGRNRTAPEKERIYKLSDLDFFNPQKVALIVAKQVLPKGAILRELLQNRRDSHNSSSSSEPSAKKPKKESQSQTRDRPRSQQTQSQVQGSSAAPTSSTPTGGTKTSKQGAGGQQNRSQSRGGSFGGVIDFGRSVVPTLGRGRRDRSRGGPGGRPGAGRGPVPESIGSGGRGRGGPARSRSSSMGRGGQSGGRQARRGGQVGTSQEEGRPVPQTSQEWQTPRPKRQSRPDPSPSTSSSSTRGRGQKRPRSKRRR